MALIALRDVGFAYSQAARPALHDIDLDIEPGLLYGVIGANGSGKSTLCHVIRGAVPRFYPGTLVGAVAFEGAATGDADARSRAIGYVFQNPFTQISGIKQTVFEEIALGLENLGADRGAMVRRVRAVIEDVGIERLAAKNPNGLSGGQRQLVAFAAVIAMDTPILVIDEPTSQLDPETSDVVFRLIATLRDRGKTIILVEHDIDLLAEHADRIVVLERGRIVACGAAHDVLASDAIAATELRRPEVTELALALDRAGKPLAAMPTTRGQARDLIAARMRGA